MLCPALHTSHLLFPTSLYLKCYLIAIFLSVWCIALFLFIWTWKLLIYFNECHLSQSCSSLDVFCCQSWQKPVFSKAILWCCFWYSIKFINSKIVVLVHCMCVNTPFLLLSKWRPLPDRNSSLHIHECCKIYITTSRKIALKSNDLHDIYYSICKTV